MGTEGTLSSAWNQHLDLEFAAKSADSALPTMKEDLVSHTQNGAEAILELLRSNGTDCVFASPIATMAPLWEALAARRERGEPEAPRYFHCRHEMLAVAAASGYYKATGRAQAVCLPTGLGVLHGAMALRTALQERTPMTVLSPDTLTFGEIPSLDPGPEWPSLLVDLVSPARQGELCRQVGEEGQDGRGPGPRAAPSPLLRRGDPEGTDARFRAARY